MSSWISSFLNPQFNDEPIVQASHTHSRRQGGCLLTLGSSSRTFDERLQSLRGVVNRLIVVWTPLEGGAPSPVLGSDDAKN